MTSRSYRDVGAWQRAHQLVLGVYSITRRFPRDEMFGLTSQLRRSAGSVPMNIAEGFRRRGSKDKLHFYNIAQASLDEAEYQLLLAHDLGYGNTQSLRDEADEVARMLNAYMRGLEQNNPSGPTRSSLLPPHARPRRSPPPPRPLQAPRRRRRRAARRGDA